MAAKKKAKKKPRKMIKCRLCDYRVPLWHTSPQSARPASGFDALHRHFKVDHKPEYLAIMNKAHESMGRLLPNELR
jgi:hypothetical protein